MEELSRKERRKLLREQKKSEKQNQKVFVNLKKLFITLFGCLVIGFFGFKVYKWATAPVPTVSGVSVEAKDDDWIKGNKEKWQRKPVEDYVFGMDLKSEHNLHLQ